LWPVSRRNRPKQFCGLFDHETLFGLTLRRAERVRDDDGEILVIAGEDHLPLVAPLGRESVSMIGEPVGRNTAPCIGLAALRFAAGNPDAVMAVLPADHLIEDNQGFEEGLRLAAKVARQAKSLVTFGIKPSTPHTGFGYIETGALIPVNNAQVRAVTAFTEKPDQSRAEQYLATGRYYWNAGIFVWRAADILALIDKHLPALGQALERVRPGLGTDQEAEAVRRFYLDLPSEAATSIDYGVMESAATQGRVVMVEAGFDWDDMGGWPVLARHWDQDDPQNDNRYHAAPDPVVHDASGNIIHADGKLVALLGVSDLIVVDAEVDGREVLLVCPRDRAEEVRKLVEKVQSRADLEDYL
jgi:mannose-1-phosphate guanylyltransferase